MAIPGLGTDIVEVTRIETMISRSGNHLARRVLSDNEWTIWETHQQPVRFLARRFAVREAAAKAFGTGTHNGLALNQFEVSNGEPGKLCLRLRGEVLKLAEKLDVVHMHVTLADGRHYACATAIIESQTQDAAGWQHVASYLAYGLYVCYRGRVGASLPDDDAAKVYRRDASAQIYPTATLLLRRASDLSKQYQEQGIPSGRLACHNDLHVPYTYRC